MIYWFKWKIKKICFHCLCKNADNNLEIMFFLNVGGYRNNNSLTIVYKLENLMAMVENHLSMNKHFNRSLTLTHIKYEK